MEICRPFPPWFEGNFSEELSLYCCVYAGNDGSNCLCPVYYVELVFVDAVSSVSCLTVGDCQVCNENPESNHIRDISLPFYRLDNVVRSLYR